MIGEVPVGEASVAVLHCCPVAEIEPNEGMTGVPATYGAKGTPASVDGGKAGAPHGVVRRAAGWPAIV